MGWGGSLWGCSPKAGWLQLRDAGDVGDGQVRRDEVADIL